MKRGFYYLLKFLAISSRILRSKKIYMTLITKAHYVNGVKFLGKPKFIHPVPNTINETVVNTFCQLYM